MVTFNGKINTGKIEISGTDLEELKRDAERYRFLRDVDSWGIESDDEHDDDTWDDLTEAQGDEFDRIVDSRIAKDLAERA